MNRDLYEIYLLEVRQGLKDAEAKLKNQACIDIFAIKRILSLEETISKELISHRNNKPEVTKKRINKG